MLYWEVFINSILDFERENYSREKTEIFFWSNLQLVNQPTSVKELHTAPSLSFSMGPLQALGSICDNMNKSWMTSVITDLVL